MLEDIRRKQAKMAERYVSSPRHTIQVDWIPYMDELAEQVGCKPDIGMYTLGSNLKAYAVCLFLHITNWPNHCLATHTLITITVL